jgi:hypothetical protein
LKSLEIFLESLKIRDQLKKEKDYKENPIDDSLLIVLPFRISNQIKLIILGQDPTVKNSISRKTIKYTLNLDKSGSLKKYIGSICSKLGINYENIYASNVFKYFYSKPPQNTMNILQNHLEPNLGLLIKELSEYPHLPILTLGLPVLQLLTNPDSQVRDFWGYDTKTKKRVKPFSFCAADSNKLKRNIFPFPHQPSLRKQHYTDNLDDYIKFMKTKI